MPIPQRIIITASQIPIAANIELISGPESIGSGCGPINSSLTHSPSRNTVPSPHASSNKASLASYALAASSAKAASCSMF